MIIVYLTGGLGNQMFQYALGRKLSIINKTELRLDTSWFDSGNFSTTPREYELNIFNIKAELATGNDIRKLKEPYTNPFFRMLYSRYNSILPYYKRNIVEENQFDFDKNILKTGDNTFFYGYWQSDKYFYDIRNELLNDFTLKNDLSEKNAELAVIIDKCESVSIHVRRADYVSDTRIHNVHGVCSESYYDNAIRYLSVILTRPVFFIFSDDIEWCKTHLKFDGKKYFISHNTGNTSCFDMRLMSLCRHNIIANSSFSWWSAWLNTNPGKIIIAPQTWFRDPSKNTKDLIPDTWQRL